MKASPSMLGQAIRAAVDAKEDDQKAGKPESKDTSKSDDQQVSEEHVNLSIRVNRAQRLHWLIEAKKQGTNLTEAITDALITRFGSAPQE